MFKRRNAFLGHFVYANATSVVMSLPMLTHFCTSFSLLAVVASEKQ